MSKSIPIRRGFSYFLSSCFCFAPFPPFFYYYFFFSPIFFPPTPFPLYLLFFSLLPRGWRSSNIYLLIFLLSDFSPFFFVLLLVVFPFFFSFPNFFFLERLRERRSSKEEQKNNGEIQSYIKRRKNQLLAKRSKHVAHASHRLLPTCLEHQASAEVPPCPVFSILLGSKHGGFTKVFQWIFRIKKKYKNVYFTLLFVCGIRSSVPELRFSTQRVTCPCCLKLCLLFTL